MLLLVSFQLQYSCNLCEIGSDPVSFSPLTADSVTALATQSTSDFVTWQQSQQQPAQLALTGYACMCGYA